MAGRTKSGQEHHQFDNRERRPINCAKGEQRMKKLVPLSEQVVLEACDLGVFTPIGSLGGGYYIDQEQIERGLCHVHRPGFGLEELDDLESDDFSCQ